MYGKVVTFKNGMTGKVIGRLENGDFVMMYEKGGRNHYFKKEDVVKIKGE